MSPFTSARSSGQQGQRAVERREGPAPADVRRQQHRAAGVKGKVHVHDVAGPQVQLHRAARALGHHHFKAGRQPVVGPAGRFAAGIPVKAGRGRAVHHRLAAVVAGDEQHRVHVRLGGKAAGRRRDGLTAGHPPPVGQKMGVVGDVLGLERGHPQPPPAQKPAKADDQRALAHAGGGAQHHQGLGSLFHGALPCGVVAADVGHFLHPFRLVEVEGQIEEVA